MPRACSVCLLPEVPHINAALAAGASLRTIAGEFGASKSAIERHVSAGHNDTGQAETAPVVTPAGAPPEPHAEAVQDEDTAPLVAASAPAASEATIPETAPRIDAEAGHAEHPCPECGSEMVLADQRNPHKLNTGWCVNHGRQRLPAPAVVVGWPSVYC